MPGPYPPYIQDLISAKAAATAGLFAPDVTSGAATKTAGPPPDWIISLIQSNMAAKAAAAKAAAAKPTYGAIPPSAAYNFSQAKRDLSSSGPSGSSVSAQQPLPQQPQMAMAPFNPFFAPYPQLVSAPQQQSALPLAPPVPFPMMPMMPPMPYWKFVG